MKRETTVAVLQLVGTIREDLREVRTIVDHESLHVGDRNMIEHTLIAISTEIEALFQTLSDLLNDPTRTGVRRTRQTREAR